MLRLVKVGKGEMFDGIRAGLQKCLRITCSWLTCFGGVSAVGKVGRQEGV